MHMTYLAETSKVTILCKIAMNWFWGSITVASGTFIAVLLSAQDSQYNARQG